MEALLGKNDKILILDWLKNNKDLINDFIKINGLYNVWIRGEDDYLDPTKETINDSALVASCSTFELAEKWIFNNGRDCIESQKENCSRMAVLTIIYQKNYDEGDVDYPTDYSGNYMIASRKYPTYAFSKKDYLVTLEEHKKVFRYDMCDKIIPIWIFRIKKNGDVIRGCNRDNILNILENYDDGEWKNKKLKEYDLYYAPIG